MKPSIHVAGHWMVGGPRFSPGAAEQATQVLFSEKTEPGTIATRGRYRGQPAPQGWGRYEFAVDAPDADLIAADSPVLATLQRCIAAYRAAGAQEITLHFNVAYASQCNLQLSAPLMRQLATLGVDVTLTCFPDE